MEDKIKAALFDLFCDNLRTRIELAEMTRLQQTIIDQQRDQIIALEKKQHAQAEAERLLRS